MTDNSLLRVIVGEKNLLSSSKNLFKSLKKKNSSCMMRQIDLIHRTALGRGMAGKRHLLGTQCVPVGTPCLI